MPPTEAVHAEPQSFSTKSAIEWPPAPFRLSGNAAQASCSLASSRSGIGTTTSNQKAESSKVEKMHPGQGHLDLLFVHIAERRA
jgi:hypothetical protein